ncbi:MAG TPA: hypothetical protein PKA41_14115 [Verrucomicrobiota bacterium]|nr:hypothetical protein [Verrucomicrobiota bacterium]
MQLRYDEDFIEAAVFLCASGRRKGVPSLQIARFHREREKLYAILDPDERNTAFFKLHLDWFREWGLEQPLTEVLKGFPLVREQLGVLAVRKTTGKNDEGAELYVNKAGQRTGLLALKPEWLADGSLERSAAFRPLQPENVERVRTESTAHDSRSVKRAEARAPIALRDYLRHEFTHLHDMLNPAFGYSPALELPGLNGAQQRLARERYRLLWDITIDGRLTTAGLAPMATREQHATAFARGYSFWSEAKQTETFSSLWQSRSPKHADFLALIADPRGLRDAHRPEPGASCPLCDFPTFKWADENMLPPEIIVRITAEFPAWQPEQSLCGRCLETYEAVASQAVTATT